MAQKILNIDGLSRPDVKVVTLDGRSHEMAETTVDQYVSRMRRARKLPADASVEDQILETVSLLADLFPTLSEDRLKKLPLAHLEALLDFAMAPPEDIAAKVEAAQGPNPADAPPEGNAPAA